MLRDIFLFLIFFYRDDRLEERVESSIRADVPKESVREGMYVLCVSACVERKKRGGRDRKREENGQEDEDASISVLELRLPNYGIMYAKRAVVARGDFRELPLLRLITWYPPKKRSPCVIKAR